MKSSILVAGLVVGLAVGVSMFQMSAAHADDSATSKVENAAGDAKTNMKKAGRSAEQTGRKAVGKDTLGKDVKDKANDVGDDMSNSVDKAKRKAK